MSASREQRSRTGARVLLLDPDGHVLLVREPIGDGTHWLAPGGGVEAGEQLPEAAARELYEETGVRIDLLPGALPVHTTTRTWPSRAAAVDYHQTDHFFVVSVDVRPPVAPAALTPFEQEANLEFAWWSVEALRANVDQVIEPPDLADLLERLHRALRGPMPPA